MLSPEGIPFRESLTGFPAGELVLIKKISLPSPPIPPSEARGGIRGGEGREDRVILENIQSWFGVGRIYSSGTKVYYRVESFKDLLVIIDHFDKYPLVTAKKLDYALFKKSFGIIKLNEHLTEQGISKLIEYFTKVHLIRGGYLLT